MELPSDFIAKNCQHAAYRNFCVACRVKDTDRQYKEACGLVKKLEDEIADWEAQLQGCPAEDDKIRLDADLKKSRYHLPAWQQRAHVLGEQRSSTLKAIEEQYAVAEDERVALFETRAKQKEDEVKSVLGSRWINLVPADPNGKQVAEKPLDRSNIPATPDVLVNDGVGLQASLSLSIDDESDSRNPMRMPGNDRETDPRDAHKSAVAHALANWQPTEEFISRTSHEPDPRKHYNGDEPLWVKDGRDLGWKI